jgi:iron complex outermembrane receptor protein
VLAYASWARGYKSGGINMAGIPTRPDGTPALTSAVVEPEQVTTYEAGLKTQLFDRRVTANLAAYVTDIEDFQANVVDAGPGALRGYLANIEKVEVRGAELDIAVRPIAGVSGYATLAFTDGRYASFRNGPCPLERIGPATAACDLSGQELPGRVPLGGVGGAEHRRPARFGAVSGDAYVGGDVSYRSAYFSDASASRYTRIPEYALLNLRAGFESETAGSSSPSPATRWTRTTCSSSASRPATPAWSSATPATAAPSASP